METSVKDIYAAGDIAEFKEKVYGIWPPSFKQVQTAGANMSGQNNAFEGFVPSHKLKVAGINVVSIGELNKENQYQEEVLEDNQCYVKVIKEGSSKIGAVIVGDYAEQNSLLSEIK
jgi:nitrite reductase (NADH) large subunit